MCVVRMLMLAGIGGGMSECQWVVAGRVGHPFLCEMPGGREKVFGAVHVSTKYTKEFRVHMRMGAFVGYGLGM